MGVEFRLIRKDTKTIFDLGKRLGYEIIDLVFSQEQLFEYLMMWQLNLWEEPNMISALLIRDRLLDFVEGAKLSDLSVSTDSFDEEYKDFTFTHDRYVQIEDSDKYRKLLTNIHIEEYTENPLLFFRNSGISKGSQIEFNNRLMDYFR